MNLRFVCLGVGDAFSARSYSSCYALESEGTWLLVDCPHPIRKILREAGEECGEALDIARFSGVVLTHLHADHATGLEGWGFYSHFLLGRSSVFLTHPEVSEPLWDRHLAVTMGTTKVGADGQEKRLAFDDYFELRSLNESSATQFGPFSIECRRTIHHIPTFALRIRAGGRYLGFSADTAYDPGLIEWLSEADLIVHEANYGGHAPYEKLAALPASLRGKMRLTHYPDDFNLARSAIEPLRQGGVYTV